jgi:heparan-sulfate lyase
MSRRRIAAFPLIVIVMATVSADAVSPETAAVTDLLAKLDLARPELAPVRRADDADRSAALLRLYRRRDDFHHPVDRSRRLKVRGRYASPHSVTMADKAVRNILETQRSYPPHDFGKEIDWSHNPTRDNEWLWQLHRMYSWNHLARAYWRSGDEKYASAWARQLLHWIEHNPLDEDHRYAWRTIEAGIRGHSWVGLFQHFLDSPKFTPDVLAAFMKSCHEHAAHLHASLGRKPGGGNWRLMEAEGLAHIAICFPQFRQADAWRRRAFKVLTSQIARQVRDDGMHFEQCFNYHSGCIHWFARTAELARRNGYGEEFGDAYFDRIELMCAALMKLCFPDGMTAQFGDTSGPVNVRPVLKQWADFFGRDDFRYVATSGKSGKAPADRSFALTRSGFYAMRSSWGPKATALVLKCGPDGGWHCQPDNGTFEIFAGGRRLTPDSGTYIYSGDKAGREWFRLTRVHQTLTLDGGNSRYAPRHLLWQSGEKLDALVVENRGYDKLTHRRAVLFVNRRFFVVIDDAIGRAAGNVDVHFQLAPADGEPTIDAKALTARTGFEQGTNLQIVGFRREGLTMAAEKGQVSFKYGQRQARPAFRFRLRKSSDTKAVRFVMVLTPYAGEPPVVRIEPVAKEAGGGRVELEVAVGRDRFRVGYDLSDRSVWLAPAD